MLILPSINEVLNLVRAIEITFEEEEVEVNPVKKLTIPPEDLSSSESSSEENFEMIKKSFKGKLIAKNILKSIKKSIKKIGKSKKGDENKVDFEGDGDMMHLEKIGDIEKMEIFDSKNRKIDVSKNKLQRIFKKLMSNPKVLPELIRGHSKVLIRQESNESKELDPSFEGVKPLKIVYHYKNGDVQNFEVYDEVNNDGKCDFGKVVSVLERVFCKMLVIGFKVALGVLLA